MLIEVNYAEEIYSFVLYPNSIGGGGQNKPCDACTRVRTIITLL